MRTSSNPLLDHLQRLTGPQGLIHSAQKDFPDSFAGYHALENADALRLCAFTSDTVDADTLHRLAKIYYAFLSRARRDDGRIYHHCDAKGQWSNKADDWLVQARLARALSAVIVSELPIKMRLSAADWWRELLPHADNARSPLAVANWLMAIGQLRTADPGRDLDRAKTFASWLIEDCYYPIRSLDWEWFESHWIPTAAHMPAALWQAYAMLGERRYAAVAEVTTKFLIQHLFEGRVLMPVGTNGGWSKNTNKAVFDVLSSEVCSIVELLQLALKVSRNRMYREYANLAANWFTGDNIQQIAMIDDQDGGCYDALTITGVDRNQGASAITSCLLAHVALSMPSSVTQESTDYVIPVG